MNLKIELRKLVGLQEIDREVYQFQQERDVIKPKQLAQITEKFNECKKTLESFEEEVKQAQLGRKEKELDLATKEESVTKTQSQLFQLKTNKEYQAKLAEIASLKADVSVLEEEVLKSMEIIESAQSRLNEQREKVTEIEKKFKVEESRLQTEIKDLDAKIQTFADKRTVITRDVDPKILKQYEQLLAVRAGIAIAPILNSNCGACHMRVTHQTVNEVKMYKSIVLCANCLRMLYIADDIS